ncbi:hypothetical protein BaRGS_00005956 [Batillaria attramentaria]|uniref:Uncharacterized protein n=1 Tax=Batillaria attramentaria TaxID=370345 RepID=A0ABD0LT82_9CAEN
MLCFLFSEPRSSQWKKELLEVAPYRLAWRLQKNKIVRFIHSTALSTALSNRPFYNALAASSTEQQYRAEED